MFLQIEFCLEAWGRVPVLTLGEAVRRATREYQGEPCLGLACKTQGCAFHQLWPPTPAVGSSLQDPGPASFFGPQTSRLPNRDPATFSGRGGRGSESAGGGDLPGPGRVCPCARHPPCPPVYLRSPGVGGRQGRAAPGGRHWPFVTCPAPSRRALRAAGAGGAGGARPPPSTPPPSPPVSAWVSSLIIFVKPAPAPLAGFLLSLPSRHPRGLLTHRHGTQLALSSRGSGDQSFPAPIA